MDALFELTIFFSPQILMSFAVTAALCWLIITYSSRSSRMQAMVADTHATQAMHKRPTARVGGVAIFISFALVLSLNSHIIKLDVLAALLAVSIVFIAGLKEDLYRNVSPKTRLFAAFLSAGAASYFSGSLITHLDLPGGTAVPAFFGFWVVVTLVWSAGTCHALNLIDGLNGLASGYVVFATIALSLIAAQTGDRDIFLICLLLIGATLGFYVFNWPYGKIFLGDAGAYGLGHILAWLGIVLSTRQPELSPLALLLILFWPVTDTAFTIFRRLIYRHAVGQPDRFHFHHIVVRVVSRLAKGRLSHTMKNSIASLIIYPLLFVPAILGVIFWNKPAFALVALLTCLTIFMASYIIILDLLAARKLRSRATMFELQLQKMKPASERSSLSGIFIEDNLAVNIHILRRRPGSEWTLEAVADQAPGRSWNETFRSDLEAWNAFIETLKNEGIEAIAGYQKPSDLPPRLPHS